MNANEREWKTKALGFLVLKLVFLGVLAVKKEQIFNRESRESELRTLVFPVFLLRLSCSFLPLNSSSKTVQQESSLIRQIRQIRGHSLVLEFQPRMNANQREWKTGVLFFGLIPSALGTLGSEKREDFQPRIARI